MSDDESLDGYCGADPRAAEKVLTKRMAAASQDGEWRSQLRPKDKLYSASEWNSMFRIGTRVNYRRDSGGDLITATQSEAFYMEGNWSQQGHKVFLEGVSYPVTLERLTPIPK